jgi:hypothetical protein
LVGVAVGVNVGVWVGVLVGVFVGVLVGVLVGVKVGARQAAPVFASRFVMHCDGHVRQFGTASVHSLVVAPNSERHVLAQVPPATLLQLVPCVPWHTLPSSDPPQLQQKAAARVDQPATTRIKT